MSAELSTILSREAVGSWDEAIAAVQGKIERLEGAIQTFIENKENGMPFPAEA